MFEFLLAWKYLIPRKRRLSTSLISIVSIVVISCVVWLVLIFLSVTDGIEKNWLNKLTSLNAPIRITPTSSYFDSYYYKIDTYSETSSYSPKTIGQKSLAEKSDPFDEDVDLPLPSHFPTPEKSDSGTLIDPVKKLDQSLKNINGITYQDYEISGALLRLSLVRDSKPTSYLSQVSYLLSFPDKNPHLKDLLIPSSSLNESIKDNLKKTISSQDEKGRFGVFLPKSMQDSGVKIDDNGYLSYGITTPMATQEERIKIFVAGFYDPGPLPIGSRFLLVPFDITRQIQLSSATFSPDGMPTNGIFVWFDNLSDVDKIKDKIEKGLEKEGIAKYWKVSTYKEFEFSKDLFEQFQSDKTLFTLIAVLILAVACSNIVSLLIILVNDKKKEIATLQAMGAKRRSVALIFGLCGVIMGLVSTCIGTLLALFTLKHLDLLVRFLSTIQGHAAFNTAFFGKQLPNTFSIEALVFIVVATPLLSLLAGLIPAIKACSFSPSATLRSE